jgi:cell wall-associated NlpC family hydrolase
MASTPDGRGYWLVASDGGIFSFGDARFHGSLGRAHLTQPIVGMASTADGRGYWLVAGDAGVFAFGNARYYRSLGRQSLAQPVVGMASTSDGRGYWLLSSNGHVNAFGHSKAFGSMTRGDIPAVSIAPSGVGGYITAFADGTVWRFDPGRRPAVALRLRVPSVYVAAAIQKAVSARAIAVALAQAGKPYSFGGNGPYSFDCSGLTKFAYAAAGVALPRTAAEQFAAVPHVPLAQAEPGDLLFFYAGVDHVGIYLGDGLMVDAPHAGAPVRIEAFEPGFGPVMGVGRPA